MSTSSEKARLPIFDGDEDNYDKWEIQWKAFAQVENMVSALVKALDTNMHASVLEYEKTEKTGTTDKEKTAAVKANCQAMANLALALKPMELLRLLTRAIATKWPEGEAWKVMTQLQEIYQPNDVQSIAEVRYKLGNLKMGADQNPSILFCQLATLEHAYAHTKGRITDDDIIGTIFAVAPEKYPPTLNLVAENRGANLMPSHLEMAMRKIWHQNGGNKGICAQVASKRNTEIVLNAFMGICYVRKEKGHRASHCPTKEQKGNNNSNNSAKRRFSGKCNHCGKAGHKKIDCWESPENAEKRPSSYRVPVNMLMFMWTIAGVKRLSMSYALLKLKVRNTVKDI